MDTNHLSDQEREKFQAILEAGRNEIRSRTSPDGDLGALSVREYNWLVALERLGAGRISVIQALDGALRRAVQTGGNAQIQETLEDTALQALLDQDGAIPDDQDLEDLEDLGARGGAPGDPGDQSYSQLSFVPQMFPAAPVAPIRTEYLPIRIFWDQLMGVDVRPELLQSIQSMGQLVAAIVVQDGGHYQIVDGLHRGAVIRKLSADDPNWLLRCDIYPADTDWEQASVMGLASNLHRKPNPVQELLRIESLMEEGFSIQQIAKQTGIKIGTVRKRLTLTNLPPEIRHGMIMGEIAVSTAEAVAKLPPVKQSRAVAMFETLGALTGSDVADLRRVHTEAAIMDLPDSLFDTPAAGTMPEAKSLISRMEIDALRATVGHAKRNSYTSATVPVDLMDRLLDELDHYRTGA